MKYFVENFRYGCRECRFELDCFAKVRNKNTKQDDKCIFSLKEARRMIEYTRTIHNKTFKITEILH